MSAFFIMFLIFFKLSFFSFGGGYAMLPMIEQELLHYGITLQSQQITDITAVASMAPGPVAVNAAVAFGYQVGGIWGVVGAFLGVSIPCAIIVIVVATFFFKVYNNEYVQGALKGLRPVIVGIVAYAALNMAMKNHLYTDWSGILIALAAFGLLLKTKVHPIAIILGSGVLGILLYGVAGL